MKQQSTIQTPKQTMSPQTRGLLLHAAVRATADHDLFSNSSAGSRFGHDFSQVAVHPSVSVIGQNCSNLSFPSQIQAKLKIGQPGDRYEQEADRVAEQVMRMPEPRLSSSVGDSSPANSGNPNSGTIQRVCAPCSAEYKAAEDENRSVEPANLCPKCRTQEGNGLIQTKTTGVATPEVTPAISSGIQSLQGGGRPLSESERGFFEPRFGADFSGVRVHDNARAAGVARSVGAQAFTHGIDVVFGAGEYSPNSSLGRKLFAHELVHVGQQNGGLVTSSNPKVSISGSQELSIVPPKLPIQQQTSVPKIQRRLTVNRNHPTFAPSTDPAASLTSAQRFSMMGSVIQALCNEYEVDSTSGEVLAKSRTTLDRTELARGIKPTGCCCLSVLTDAVDNWIIEVSQVMGPQTIGRQVVLSPTSTPVEFGSFTSTNSLSFQGTVPAAGHELCGHAALIEISAHPDFAPRQDRTTTDVHDPTVNIENVISTEQGVPASDLRGTARSGTHRGESVDRVVIGDYNFNQTSIPASQNGKVNFTADYIARNNSFVDILGHSDNVGSVSAKRSISDSRAQNVKTRLIRQGVSTAITRFGFTSVNRFTRVEGLSDTLPPLPPFRLNQDNWRRTEILISGFPAGAQNPPVGTPNTVASHRRSRSLGTVRRSSDECVRLLARGAYP